MSRTLGIFPIAANYEVRIAEALDARSRVSLQADLISGELPYPYNGMIVTVYGETDPKKNGTYWLKNAAQHTLITSWKRLDAPENTDELEEGVVNKYFKEERVRDALSFSPGQGDYDSSLGLFTIPTDTSHLDNSAGFITSSALSDYYTKTEIEVFFSGGISIIGYKKTSWDEAHSWGDHAASGYIQAARFVFNEKVTGIVDGVNNTFSLANEPIPGKLMVFVNGMKLDEGVDNDFVQSGLQIIFNPDMIPMLEAKISATYIF